MHLLNGCEAFAIPQSFLALADHLPLLRRSEAIDGSDGKRNAPRDDNLSEVDVDRAAQVETDLLEDFLRFFLERCFGADLDGTHTEEYSMRVVTMSIHCHSRLCGERQTWGMSLPLYEAVFDELKWFYGIRRVHFGFGKGLLPFHE